MIYFVCIHYMILYFNITLRRSLMEPYKKMYLCLFHAITDALELLPEKEKAAALLREAQKKAEEMYITAGEVE